MLFIDLYHPLSTLSTPCSALEKPLCCTEAPELPAEDAEARVPDAVQLVAAQQGGGHPGGHALGEVVEGQLHGGSFQAQGVGHELVIAQGLGSFLDIFRYF